jgi:hypothetical protein
LQAESVEQKLSKKREIMLLIETNKLVKKVVASPTYRSRWERSLRFIGEFALNL